MLSPSELDVFVISGSNEEKDRYAQRVLDNVDCRIVLCSVQYVEEAFERTWDYVFSEDSRSMRNGSIPATKGRRRGTGWD